MRHGRLLFSPACAARILLGSAHAQIGLPKVIGDNMVLQQGEPAAIWGSGIPGRKVSVRFAGQNVRTTVGDDGSWMLKLEPMEASFEPRTMTISDGKATVRLHDAGRRGLAGLRTVEHGVPHGQALSRGAEPGTGSADTAARTGRRQSRQCAVCGEESGRRRTSERRMEDFLEGDGRSGIRSGIFLRPDARGQPRRARGHHQQLLGEARRSRPGCPGRSSTAMPPRTPAAG